LVSAYLDALVAHRCTGSRHAAALYFASEWCLDRLPLGELSDVALREIDSFHDALFEGRGLRDSPTASTQISRWSTRNSDHSTSPSRAHPAERGADPSLGLLCDSEGVQVQLERIDRVRAKCVADPRVQAALIYGSFFRGEADEHSDIEFWVYLSKEALPDFDPRAWLEAIAPLRALFENEFGTSVAIFDDAMRGEFHCVSEDRISEIREWRSLEGTGQPEMIVVDRRGLLSRALREVAQRGTPQASAAIAC
jgi:predicted nucleotidyltransferase